MCARSFIEVNLENHCSLKIANVHLGTTKSTLAISKFLRAFADLPSRRKATDTDATELNYNLEMMGNQSPRRRISYDSHRDAPKLNIGFSIFRLFISVCRTHAEGISDY